MREPGRRKGTATSEFGVSKRENHDATAFYARFTAPEFSDREDVDPHKAVDDIFCHDASSMPEIADDSVALVVTSPPYFAGKAYETALGEGHVPANYLEYLEMLHGVFSTCVRKLEPGGRIAINVANLGRRPYRSLSADVIKMLEEMGLLLRGEVIWVKARGAGGSCAWGSFQRPGNPVLRDLTERIIIASKERFDRAIPAAKRAPHLPHEWSLFKDEFMEATTDVWEMPPESATRVGHPAPFPVELPERLIHLYTYVDDLVLDPFMGSGTSAVVAVRTSRHFAGYDTDPNYVERALARVQHERRLMAAEDARRSRPVAVRLGPRPVPAPDDEDFQARAVREGRAARDLALEVLEQCGFRSIRSNEKFPEGVEVNFEAEDAGGGRWLFDVSGGFTSSRPGLKRTDTLWKALGKASVLHALPGRRHRLVLLTTDLPAPNSAGEGLAGRIRAGSAHPRRDQDRRAGRTPPPPRLRRRPPGGRPLSEAARGRWPGRVAVGIVRSDPPEVYIAEDEFVLSRVLALKVVATAAPELFDAGGLERVRAALLEERWADAVFEWIEASGLPVDGYPDEELWTEVQLDEDTAAMEIRVSRIFDDR